jgi:hypothetical protein
MVMRLPSIVPATLVLLSVLAAPVVSACSKENTKLMVTALEPNQGDTEGETYIRIKGNRFTADGPRTAKVYFGGRQGHVIRFESDNEMVVQPPGGKDKEVVDVLIVFDPGGSLKIPSGFKFVEKRGNMPSVDDLGTKSKK